MTKTQQSKTEQISRQGQTGLLWLLFSLGVVASFRTTINIFSIDSDAANLPTLWIGLREYGWSFLKHWAYTPDNWLLTLAPLNFALYSVFGTDPKIPIFSGAAFFSLSAIASMQLTEIVLKSKDPAQSHRQTGLIVACALLFLGFYAHRYGFASYSASHNSTNLLGLINTLLTLRYLRDRRLWTIALSCIISIAAAISDPWYLAPYTLPATITPLLLLALTRCAQKKRLLWLIGSNLLVLVAAKTKLFYILNFLPRFDFSAASPDLASTNLAYFLKDAGAFFNLMPWNDGNQLRYSLINIAIVTLLSCFIGLSAWRRAKDNERLGYFTIFSIVSMLGIASALITSSTPAGDLSGRFIINIPYLLLPLIAIHIRLEWAKFGITKRAITVAATLLMIYAGAATTQKYWTGPVSSVETKEVVSIENLLKRNNLMSGFGPYWGSQANAVSWLSGGETIIRPIAFDKDSGHMLMGVRAQSSDLWTTPNDLHGRSTNFVIVANDGEECPDIALCLKGIAEQFGTPERVIIPEATADHLPVNSPILSWRILVWPYNILAYVKPRDYTVGQQLNFSNKQPGAGWPGFSSAEPWGSWTVGPLAKIALRTRLVPTENYELILSAAAFSPKKQPTQVVSVYINDTPLGTLVFPNGDEQNFKLKLPPQQASSNGIVQIAIKIAHPISPRDAGINDDGRPLGIGLHSMSIEKSE